MWFMLQWIEGFTLHIQAVIAQLGERQTEDLKVPGSIPGRGNFFFIFGHTNTKFISTDQKVPGSNPSWDTIILFSFWFW